MQLSATEIPHRIADEFQPSIMQRGFRESSKQVLAEISELAEAYDNDCKYQLLLVGLRRKLRVQSGELSPRYYLKFVYLY
jgi:hypothetical protein